MNNKIQLNATGETVTFTKTAYDTGGEFLEGIVTLPANAEGPPPHRHVLQTETFEVLEGNVEVMCNGEKQILKPGQSFTVPANGLHSFHTANGRDIRFKATLTPALQFQYMLTEVFASCNRRKSNQPSVFDATFILNQIKGEYRLGNVPVFVQRNFFPVIALIGRIFGLVKAQRLSKYHQLKLTLSAR